MSPLDPCPCWGPTPWRWGSLWSVGSVHCGWTWHLTRRKWSLRRRICCPDLQVLQTLTDDRRTLDFLHRLHSHRISRRCSRLVCLSQSAEALMSQRRSVPLLLLYTNRWQWWGWNSADVITSVRSSMLAGLMSTISEKKLRIEPSRVERSQKKHLGYFSFLISGPSPVKRVTNWPWSGSACLCCFPCSICSSPVWFSRPCSTQWII